MQWKWKSGFVQHVNFVIVNLARHGLKVQSQQIFSNRPKNIHTWLFMQIVIKKTDILWYFHIEYILATLVLNLWTVVAQSLHQLPVYVQIPQQAHSRVCLF